MVVGALHDPFGNGHMGVTAENAAERYGISREEQDLLAVESHRRAAAAITAGYFKEQIAPVELPSRKGVVIFDTDEHPRADTSAGSTSALRPAFKKDGTVTAGNASNLNDGAGALVLASGAEVKRRGLQPMARIVAYGHAGVPPEVMGLGPIPALQRALRKAGLTVADIDVVESNEAFCRAGLRRGEGPRSVSW